MAAAKQRPKYRPQPTPNDLCKCTRTGAAKDFGEVTHQYPYYDSSGTRLYSRFRYLITVDNHSAGPRGDKTFRYCHHYDRANPEHVSLVYGLPRVKEAIRLQVPSMYLTEGEGDDEAAWALADVYATTTHLGTRFPAEVAEHFRGYSGIVYVMVDRDHLDGEHQERFNHEDPKKQRDYPGAASALRRWRALKAVGVKAFFREAAKGKDLRDHLEAGRTIAQLKKVTLDQVKERAPKEAGLKRLDALRLATSDLPEGPGMLRFVQALEAKGHSLEQIGPTRYKTNCPNPNHPDRNPSFEFEQGQTSEGVGCVRMWCQSANEACTDRESMDGLYAICQYLEITKEDLFDNKGEGKISIAQKKKEVKEAAVDPESYPAFHDAFEGLIGRTTDNEPNDKGNGSRMFDLYGRVFRSVGGGRSRQWFVWTGTHWAVDTQSLISRATFDLTDYMSRVELPQYIGDEVPSFPEHWTVANANGTTYSSLLGKNGAINGSPIQLAAWIAKSPTNANFFGDRLKAEQGQDLFIETEKWIEKCKEGARMREAAKQLEHHPGISVTIDEFDNVRGSFVVQNGQINTQTCELEKHNIEELNTRLAPIRYNPRAKAPIWEAYLAKNQPDPKTRKYLQKLTGYAMSGDGNQKLIAFLYSKMGDTGKSIFSGAIEAVMGKGQYSVQLAEGVLSKRRFDNGGRDPDREDIRGRRLALSMELAPNEPLDERFVKQLTGGDGVSTRGNYAEGNKRWQPECLVMVATNHLSRINAEDEAIWNRIQVVPWKVAFPPGHPERDDKLMAKLIGLDGFQGELEGILNWIVEGLRLYRAEGLAPPDEVVAASMAYRSDADVVQKWLNAAAEEGEILVSEEAFTSKRRDLYKMLQDWAKDDRSRDVPGVQAFYARLEELGFRMGTKKLGEGDNDKRKVLIGIGIPDESMIKFKIG